MARLTNAQLLNELTTLREHCARREAAWEATTAELAALKAAAPAARPAYVPRPPSTEQLALRAAMAAARELAMRTGRSVRVGE